MNSCFGNLPRADERSSARGRATCGYRQAIARILGAAVFCIGLLVAVPGEADAASLDEAAEQYRSCLIMDIDRTVASVRKMRESIATNDLDAAKRAWIDARIGWERSEVFTGGFVPELDKSIDAWPNGLVGFHAIEAKLFGAGDTGVKPEVDALLQSLSELGATVREIKVTPQGLLNGIARLAYEVGESKVDGGESRISGTSIDDMRSNVDGIELAYRTVFASAIEARDRQRDEEALRQIDELKAMLVLKDLRRLDPDKLRAISEELVLTLQNAAPQIGLERPTLEEGTQ